NIRYEWLVIYLENITAWWIDLSFVNSLLGHNVMFIIILLSCPPFGRSIPLLMSEAYLFFFCFLSISSSTTDLLGLMWLHRSPFSLLVSVIL
ncbi:hypothetical protein L9F63_007117, partial [Diploptera punctata]